MTPSLEEVKGRRESAEALLRWADDVKALLARGEEEIRALGAARPMRHGDVGSQHYEMARIAVVCTMLRTVEQDSRALGELWMSVYHGELREYDAAEKLTLLDRAEDEECACDAPDFSVGLHHAEDCPRRGPDFRTKTGRVLTDADIEALADKAEHGYDVDHLRPVDEAEEEITGGSLRAAQEDLRGGSA